MFAEYIAKQGISIDNSQLDKLERYYQYLVECNEKFNLTAITDREQVYAKHFADSMLGNFAFAGAKNICDVGSGAGFPSIPLAIINSDKHFTLVDSLNKRVNFCNEVASMCKLNNVECVHSRAEDFAKIFREQFDAVTARAVAPLNILLEYLAPLVRLGGKVVAYKADDSEVNQYKNVATLLGVQHQESRHFELPQGDNRCIIVYKKVKSTPNKYPRNGNQPRKNPLT